MMIWTRRGALCALGLALCSWVACSFVPSARAQDTAADDERARLHFNAGRSYFEEGSYEQALEEFSRAYELSPRAVLLVNIANTQERLAQWGAAADSLARFIETLPENDPQVATLERRIANLRERQAQQHEVETREPVEAQPADTTTTTTERPTVTPTTEASDGLLVPALVSFGIGAAGLISFATLGGLALAEESSVAGGCGATVSCTPDQVSAMDDLALGADISLAIGLVGVVTGTILILIDPPHGASSESTSALVVPYGGRDGGGLAVAGTF